MAVLWVLVLGLIAGISALTAPDPVLLKWDSGIRFSYLEDDFGKAHLVDNWLKISDLSKMARYNPDATNQYHLYTRQNPSVSQPLLLNNVASVTSSNFDPSKTTVMIMHGFLGSATSAINTVLVPAYLSAMDCNVIVLDWSDGALWGPRATAAGRAAGRFITWLNSAVGSRPEQFQIVGYSVGGHGAGIIARNVEGDVGIVIGLDPAERYATAHVFRADDALYTEVIHTSDLGAQEALGQVDFYPNGGKSQPGCLTDICHHARSYYFLSESLVRGGFTGTRCQSVAEAHAGNCSQPETLKMGGFTSKTGSTGIYYLKTNSRQPFSQG